jgi:3-oxoacyl-[acyl-carrier-protein] synthase II
VEVSKETGYPLEISGPVKNFNAADYMDKKTARRLNAFTHYAVAASKEVFAGSGIDLEAEDATRVGVNIGSALGGTDQFEDERVIFEHKGAGRINPLFIPTIIINAAPCQVSIELGLHGPTGAPVAACATGAAAIGDAANYIKCGMADVMVAGGTESVRSHFALAGIARLGALSKTNRCTPFDVDRDGMLVAEGSAVLLLESLEHATERGAEILAELVGYGLTEDGHHLVAPDPEGTYSSASMVRALIDAGLQPDELDVIYAHGTGTPLNDVSETKAIKKALGDAARSVRITSNKSMLGHMLGAAGAISAVCAVQAILEGVVTPTINLRNPDPECDLDYTPNESRKATVRTAMVNAFGFGGQNACLVFKKWEG